MSQTEPINSPSPPKGNKHDDFFRSSFSKPYIVKKFLQHFIEAELGSPLDYDSLQLCDDTYITPELANYYSDRLWSIRFKDSADDFQFLLLFEHKSYVPQRIHLQLLRYMVEDWTKQVETQLKALQELKKKGQKKREKIHLKLILPIILYHGQKKWRVPNFEELFGQLPDSLKCFFARF